MKQLTTLLSVSPSTQPYLKPNTELQKLKKSVEHIMVLQMKSMKGYLPR
jgi:hypothetical protein